MWPTSPQRISVRRQLAHLARTRSRGHRTERHPGLERLEERQLLSGAGPFRFDFGTADSPVTVGYTQATHLTTFTSSRGYGWTGGTINSRDRGSADALTRDFDFTTDGTFAVALPNGAYNVAVTLGDSQYDHDLQGIYLQGNQVDSITTRAGQFATRNYQLTVGGGQLSVRLKDLGGVDPNAVINSLVVTSIGPNASAGASFVASEGQGVTLNGSASGGMAPLSYHWTFGDGSSAEGTLTPTVTYVSSGVFTATLTVTDAAGVSDSSSLTATINDVAPTVSILDPGSTRVGSPLGFQSTVSDPSPSDMAAGFSYLWNFGDGTTSTLASPIHTFASSGQFAVTLSVADQGGAVGTTSRTVQVSLPTAAAYRLVPPSPGSSLVGAASGAFTVALPGGQAVAGPVVVTPSDGGAGGTFSPSTLTLSNGSPSATFTYTPAKSGAITISTSNNAGLANPAAVTFQGNGGWRFDFGPASSPLAANYTRVAGTTTYTTAQGYGWRSGTVSDRDRTTPAAPLRTLNFTADATFGVDLPAGRYVVTLTTGDSAALHDQQAFFIEGNQVDTISTAQNQFVTRSYQVAITDGQLTFRVKDLGGVDPNAVINSLLIQQLAPVANAGVPATSWEGVPVTFAGAAAGSGTLSYRWDFGDGSSSDGSLTPTHAYLNSGTYTAALTVTDAYGLTARSQLTVSVGNVAPTVIAVGPGTGFSGSSLTFTANANDPSPVDQAGLTYLWDFGDGTTGTGASVTHSFARDGLYTVTVTTTDPQGATGRGTTVVDVFRPGRPGDHTAGFYLMTGPSQNVGLVNVASGAFTVSLPDYRYVTSPLVVTPSDGGAGGTFNPAQVVLTNVNRTASFTYTPSSTGAIAITTSDNAGLDDPTGFTYTSRNPVTSYTVAGPTAADLGTASTFTITLGDGLLVSPVTITPAAANGDGTFTPSSVTLSETNRTATFTYTARLWGARNLATTNDGGLSNPGTQGFLARVQLGSSGSAPAGNRTPDLGGFNFFTTGAWWQELGRTVTNDAVAPNSADLMSGFKDGKLRIDFSTSTEHGGYSIYGQPINVVSGTQPLVPLTITSYASESDPGPAPFFPDMSIQWWYSEDGLPPPQNLLPGDHHGLVMQRDETTGGISRLYEYYQLEGPAGSLTATNGSTTVTGLGTYFTAAIVAGDTIKIGTDAVPYVVQAIVSDTQITLATPFAGTTASKLMWAVPDNRAGATWTSVGGAQWDMTTGAPRREGWTTASAGGLPISPLMVNYSEASLAASGGPAINHPFRVAISPALSLNRFVWPGRHSVSGGSNVTGIPMGGRLRMNEDWYNANKGSFDPVTRAVVDAMHNYGLIVDDLAYGGMWLPGISDERWTTSQIRALGQIPDSAFEVLDTIKSPITYSGPTSGAVGTKQTFTARFNIDQDTNFSGEVYQYYSTDNGATWKFTSSGKLTDANRNQALTFTPPTPGNYLLKIAVAGQGWIAPDPVSFTATAAAQSQAMNVETTVTAAVATTSQAAGSITTLDVLNVTPSAIAAKSQKTATPAWQAPRTSPITAWAASAGIVRHRRVTAASLQATRETAALGSAADRVGATGNGQSAFLAHAAAPIQRIAANPAIQASTSHDLPRPRPSRFRYAARLNS